MASIVVNDRTAMLRRLIDPNHLTLTPDAARFLLSIRFPEEDQARVHELSAKARAGSLTADEGQELDEYLHVGNLLAIWHSKARLALKRAGEPT